MQEDTTILPFRQSETVADPLSELAREGARRMLAEALDGAADAFVSSFSMSAGPLSVIANAIACRAKVGFMRSRMWRTIFPSLWLRL